MLFPKNSPAFDLPSSGAGRSPPARRPFAEPFRLFIDFLAYLCYSVSESGVAAPFYTSCWGDAKMTPQIWEAFNKIADYLVPVISVIASYFFGRLQSNNSSKYNAMKERYEKFYVPFIRFFYMNQLQVWNSRHYLQRFKVKYIACFSTTFSI